MHIVAAFISGLLFGAGLTVAQMTNPEKVLDFLDVAAIGKGGWDPTLLMVFIGALPTMFLAYIVQRRMRRPLASPIFLVPTASPIDTRLIAGSAIFGIGWGLAGVCPGPAMTALAPIGDQVGNVALFVMAMIAGVLLSQTFTQPSSRAPPPATEPRTR